eukprot:15468330-Alexandrium_andersonii.AAC.1
MSRGARGQDCQTCCSRRDQPAALNCACPADDASQQFPGRSRGSARGWSLQRRHPRPACKPKRQPAQASPAACAWPGR